MADETEIPSCDRAFIIQALKEQFRLDGRTPGNMRKLSFKFSTDGLSSTVLMGNTRVFTTIQMEIGEPNLSQPHQGGLFFEVDFCPMASPYFEPERRNHQSVLTLRMIERLLFYSKALDREALCIIAGQMVWNLKVTIHVLDHDGNLMDACCLGALSALCAHRRPDVSVDASTGMLQRHPPEEREPLSLTLHHLPIPVSFSFFEDGDLFVLDPDLKEEATDSGSMTIVVDPQGNICGIHKVKGIGLPLSQLTQCLNMAMDRGQEIAKILQNALKTYEVERVKSRVRRKEKEEVKSEDRKVTVAGRTGLESAVAGPPTLPKDDSSETMDSSLSESSDLCNEVQEPDEIISELRGSDPEDVYEPAQNTDRTVKKYPRLSSQLPEGNMDEIKIQLAAAVIADSTENESQTVWDLRDAIKKK